MKQGHPPATRGSRQAQSGHKDSGHPGTGAWAANAYHATGSVKGIYEPGCDLFRKRMECAIMLAVARTEDEA